MKQHMVIEELIAVQGWLDAFAGHLEQCGKSERTIQAYSRDVRSFAAWFEGEYQMGFTPDQVTGVDLRNYRRWMVDERQSSPATWNRVRASLRVFCAWCVQCGILAQDPSRELQAKEAEALPPRWLERSDLQRFLRQVERQVNTAQSGFARCQAVRDQALVALMLYAGLRESEAVALDVADVQIKERSGRVVIRSGKGDKHAELPLNAEARRALSAWLHVRGSVPGALFTGSRGDRLSTRSVQRQVKALGRLAGVEVTPHMLRHSFAKRLLDQGAVLTVVQKLLRHSRLETTARYVQPGWADLEKAVEKI